MGRFVIHDDEYATVSYEFDNGKSITIEVENTQSTFMEDWSSDRLAREYKKAYKHHQPRRMSKIRNILNSRHSQDIYVRDGKVYWLTYNGCEVKVH